MDLDITIIRSEILEDYSAYFPGASRGKPVIHWGIEIAIKFNGDDIPEEPGLLSRRYIEMTLPKGVNPTADRVGKEIVMRGSKSITPKALLAKKGWGVAEEELEAPIQTQVEVLRKVGGTLPKKRGKKHKQ